MTSSSPGGVRHGGHQFSGFHGGHLGGGRRDPGRREENHFQVVGSGFRCGKESEGKVELVTVAGDITATSTQPQWIETLH